MKLAYPSCNVDLKTIYTVFIRSILEFSSTVWHSSLTNENREDLERVQKSALKIILQEKYKNYENALNLLDLESLDDRRKKLCYTFAKKCVNNEKTKHYFEHNKKCHQMKLRTTQPFNVTQAKTERLKQSAIPYMQMLLNEEN